MELLRNIALCILGGMGMIISVYFSLVYYGKLEPGARFLPQFCVMNKSDCTSILSLPEARLLRIAPNFVFGIGYYAVVIATAIWGMIRGEAPAEFGLPLTLVAWVIVAASGYLAYALVFRLRIPCKLCFTSHIVNTLIAFILTFS